VHAVAVKGTRIFTAVKKNNDDVFVSSLQLDSSASVTSAVKEDGVAGAVALPGSTDKGTAYDSVTFTYTLGIKAGANAIKGSFNWLSVSGDDFPSGEEKINVTITDAAASANDIADAGAASENKEGSMWSIFLLCLAAGLLAVITPCVFPLIPVTVSFFLKRSKTRIEGLKNALWYSLSIILIYTIPTLLLTLIFGDKILYTISTHPVSNIFFFVVFIVFAISFFGAFELALPNSWANKADQKAGKGGLLGIFFMALTLVIVSFSCTGPIVGTLLGQTSMQGVGLAPILGMMGFGVGLAIPFSLFAFFPSMLQSLPKSGGWLNTIKVSFGFIELALALKFLSNVDLSYHLGILNRDVFLVLWIVVFFLLGVYLLGKLKFAHDSDLPFVSVPRLFFAMASFSFAV
ncbi:MAG: cytochrome c biogenesis protein CcdA, partial [Sediminibacterium sp.]